MTKVAIMQPCFLPYPGYFQLMNEADKFVILDNVQFSKQSGQQRNKVIIDDKETWLTLPVKQKLGQLIKAVKIADCAKVWNISKKLKDNFGYDLAYNNNFSLYDINFINILKIKNRLALDTTIHTASELGTSDIVDLCITLGANEYLSTGGSRVYFDDNLENRFMSAGITVKFNDYEPDYSIVQYLNDYKYLKSRGLR